MYTRFCSFFKGTSLSIYLGGRYGTNFGRIDAIYTSNYTIGTICDDLWGVSAAQVACRQMGLSTYVVSEFSWLQFLNFIKYLNCVFLTRYDGVI